MSEYEKKADEIFEKYEKDFKQIKSSSLLAMQEVNRHIAHNMRQQNITQVTYWQKIRDVLKKY